VRSALPSSTKALYVGCCGHVCLHARNESVCVQGKPEGGIVFGPSGLEVGRQILVGIAIAIGAFDPDLLATQLLAQRLQRANLIGDPVDLGPTLMATVLAGIAEFERELIQERIRSGIAAAKARGKQLGRQPGQRPKSDRLAPKVVALVAKGRSYRLIGREVGLSKNTVADIVKRHRAKATQIA
jgi:hypothetical protein